MRELMLIDMMGRQGGGGSADQIFARRQDSSDGDTSETQLAGGRVCVGVHTAPGEISAGSGLGWLQTRKETGGRRSRESVYARRIRFELSARLRRTAPTTFDNIQHLWLNSGNVGPRPVCHCVL